jgi:membrane protein YqaA with SNARE-associated domain
LIITGGVRVNFLNRLNQYLMVMGIPGLLLISFLDSAGIPLVGGPDTVILLLAWHRPVMAPLIVITATIGSTLGCLVLYGIGLKGGEKALSRFNPERKARIERMMHEHGIWAIFASVIAPPPFPTKPAILAAGVLRIGKIRFVATVFAARLIRYALIGFLAVKFGDDAARVLKAHYPAIFLAIIIVVLLIVLVRHLRNRRGPSSN